MQELQLIKSAKFGEVEADIYNNNENMFMTSEQIGLCLGYSNPRVSINNLVTRNKYLQNQEFSVETKLISTDGKAYNTRVFTEDGIYEVTFLSKTDKAKEFRSWVRKILKSLRKGEMKLINADNNVSLSPVVIESIMQKYFDNTIKSEIVSIRNELTNGQKLIYSSIRKALYAPVNISKWKTEVYNITKEIAKLQPDEYKSNSYVLSEFYKIMRNTYGFVEEQSMKEYKMRHNTIANVYTIDLIADNKQYRDIFKNLLTDYLSSIEVIVDINTTSNVKPIEQLIKKRKDNSPHGVQTYRVVYKNMLSKQAWKNRTTRYKKANDVQKVNKSDIVSSNKILQRLFNKTVNEMLAI